MSTEYSVTQFLWWTHSYLDLHSHECRESTHEIYTVDGLWNSPYGLNKNSNTGKQKPILLKQANGHALSFPWQRTVYSRRDFYLAFLPMRCLFLLFNLLPYFLIYSLLQKEGFVHWQESKLKYEGNLTVFLCSFIYFSVYGLWEKKKKTKLGADFSHFYPTWENCVNWIFLKFSSHLFLIFFIILSLMVLGDESSLQAQNWPCSFNWFLGWKYKKEATKKHCLKISSHK